MKAFLLNHYLEIPAVITGLLNIYLAARANIWNWLFGIVTICLYILIFFHVKLYADMSLYFILLGLQFYGWYQWLRGGKNQTEAPVATITLKVWLFSFIAMVLLFAGIAYMLGHYTDSTTVYMDAFTAAVSLVAQWMMSKKWLENWWLWMLVDIIAIRMYLIKQLYLTSGLYAIFFALCLMGYLTWRKSLRENFAAS